MCLAKLTDNNAGSQTRYALSNATWDNDKIFYQWQSQSKQSSFDRQHCVLQRNFLTTYFRAFLIMAVYSFFDDIWIESNF
jgi:hypothetical protein